MPKQQDLRALRNMIAEAKTLLDTSPELPQGRTQRAQELLGDAVVLAEHLAAIPPAAALGKRGGLATKKKLGSEHFAKMAAMRKTRAGGRPKKDR